MSISKIAITALLFFLFIQAYAATKPATTTAFYKSAFCQNYACDDTSPYKNKDGDTAVQIRLAKDPLNLDLLGIIDGNSFRFLTLRFNYDDGRVNKTVLKDLIFALTGKSFTEEQLNQLVAAAEIKTKKDDFDTKETFEVGALKFQAGSVLKRPTIRLRF